MGKKWAVIAESNSIADKNLSNIHSGLPFSNVCIKEIIYFTVIFSSKPIYRISAIVSFFRSWHMIVRHSPTLLRKPKIRMNWRKGIAPLYFNFLISLWWYRRVNGGFCQQVKRDSSLTPNFLPFYFFGASIKPRKLERVCRKDLIKRGEYAWAKRKRVVSHQL